MPELTSIADLDAQPNGTVIQGFHPVYADPEGPGFVAVRHKLANGDLTWGAIGRKETFTSETIRFFVRQAPFKVIAGGNP